MDKIGIIAITIFVIGGGFGINMIFMWENAITIYGQCEYGSHSDFWGTRCITHSEMQEILGCNNFYLKDGYWWECTDELIVKDAIKDDIQTTTIIEQEYIGDVVFTITEPESSYIDEHGHKVEVSHDIDDPTYKYFSCPECSIDELRSMYTQMHLERGK